MDILWNDMERWNVSQGSSGRAPKEKRNRVEGTHGLGIGTI